MPPLFENDRIIIRRGDLHSGRSLLVIFDSYSDERRLDRVSFGEAFAARHSIPTVFVLSRENDWYQYQELQSALSVVHKISRDYDRVIAYGSSMGGYAAIRYGRLAGANEAIALSPQYSINPAYCLWERRWAFDSERIDFVLENSGQNAFVDHATIFFDPHDLDKHHAELFTAHCKVTLLPTRYSGHPCTGALSQMGILSKVILQIIAQSFSVEKFVRQYRTKRRLSSQYVLTLASHMSERHQRIRLALLRYVSYKNSGDAGTLSVCAEQYSIAGHYVQADILHRTALKMVPGNLVFAYRYADHLQRVGNQYDAMTLLGRLNFLSPIAIVQDRYSRAYWDCFRLVERFGMTQDEVEVAVSTTPSPPQNVTAWRRHLMQLDVLKTARPTMYVIGDSHAEYW